MARLLLRVISAHTPGGVDERAFLCGVCMFSPCPLGLVPSLKTCSNPGLYTASPWLAGAPDGGENELVGITCSFHALRPAGESLRCQSKRKRLGLLRHRRKHEISPLLPQAGRGSVAPRITLDNWHRVKNIGVAKSWDKNYKKKTKGHIAILNLVK